MLEGKRAGHMTNNFLQVSSHLRSWDLFFFWSDPNFFRSVGSASWGSLPSHQLFLPSFLRKSFYTIVLCGSPFIAALEIAGNSQPNLATEISKVNIPKSFVKIGAWVEKRET